MRRERIGKFIVKGDTIWSLKWIELIKSSLLRVQLIGLLRSFCTWCNLGNKNQRKQLPHSLPSVNATCTGQMVFWQFTLVLLLVIPESFLFFSSCVLIENSIRISDHLVNPEHFLLPWKNKKGKVRPGTRKAGEKKQGSKSSFSWRKKAERTWNLDEGHKAKWLLSSLLCAQNLNWGIKIFIMESLKGQLAFTMHQDCLLWRNVSRNEEL